ncbi:putative gustatory receptor 2a [Drosophila sulfurigaster albostrigata]|uniref:putative gustatory receptor 2a n=1 Tax=Drosophila sulfurigaster albostrigata TaxID=89887 RepID=UPI002D21AAC7|nr:putative gustatory receptor 2a [Drosophila sulfurigaster albostrigata]
MDILDAVAPLLRVSQLCNLWQWRVDPSARLLQRFRWLELYSLVILFASSGYLLYGLFDESRDESDEGGNETSNIGHTVDYIQLVGIRVAHITSLLEALWQRQTQQRFFAQLREIDRDFASMLHIDVDNAKLRQQMTRRGLWMLAGYIISQSFIIVTKMFSPDHKFPIYWICYLLPLLVCGLRYFQIYTAVLIVHQRLELLHKLLESLQLNEADPQKPYACMCIKEALQMQVAAAACMQRLITARILYQRLWLLVGLLNRCYGLSMLFNLGNDFLAITSNCYWIFLNFRQFAASPYDFMQILGSTLWTTPHLGNVLALALMCERAAYFTTRLALSLHHIRVDLQNDSHNALVSFNFYCPFLLVRNKLLLQITQFSLQLLHQRLCFSAAGFFNVDCTLLYTIVGATTTYLIILIQFHMSEISFSNASDGA